MHKDKEIRIGPEELFGESAERLTSGGRTVRWMMLSAEKDRIQSSDLPLNALGGIQSKVEFDDLRKVVTMTIELPFDKSDADWEDIKKSARAYDGERVLVIV